MGAPFVMFGFGESKLSHGQIKKRIQDFSDETGITAEDLHDKDSYEFKKAANFIDDLAKEGKKRQHSQKCA